MLGSNKFGEMGGASRRLLLAFQIGLCSVGLAEAGELAPPTSGVLNFEIIRKGDVIGHYHSDFVDRPDHVLEVRTHAFAEVKIGPIHLYDLEHRSVETWRNGRLIGMVSDTEEDGEVHHLHAEESDQQLVLTVNGKTSMIEGDAVPSSLWNRRMLDGSRPIFDSGDGQIYHTTTHCDEPAGDQDVCQVFGEFVRTLNFDAVGVLIGLTFPAEDGSKVLYRQN
jgi:hypothetical protein